MEKTIDELRTQLKEFASQALKDGHIKIHKFIFELLNQCNDAEIIKLFFCEFDNLLDEYMEIYEYLLDQKADVEWYKVITLIIAERDNFKDLIQEYFTIFKNCYESNVNIDMLHTIHGNTNTLEEFDAAIQKLTAKKDTEQKVSEIIPSKEFIDYLKAENRELKEKVESLQEELDDERKKHTELKENEASSLRNLKDRDNELEQLRKEIQEKTAQVAYLNLGQKKAKAFADHVSAVSNNVLEENQELKTKLQDVEKALDILNKNVAEEKEEKIKLNWTITQLENEIKELEEKLKHSSEHTEHRAFYLEDDPTDYEVSGDDYMEFPEEIEEIEEEEYQPEDVITITNKKEMVEKHTNIFTRLLERHEERKFEKQPIQQQESLIMGKLIENGYSDTMFSEIKRLLKSGHEFSRATLYKLLTNCAAENDIATFCARTS